MVILLLLLLATSPALAHSWYDHDCCNLSDCRPVPAEHVAEIEGGWKYLPTGNEFKNEPNMQRIRPSRDGKYHVCIGKPHAAPGQGFNLVRGFSYCIYIVQGT